MARNLEIKARCDDLGRAAEAARGAGAAHRGTLAQVDTYFHAGHGRLKLRETVVTAPSGEMTSQVELIAYQRPDQGGTRESTYTVTTLARADECRAGLAAVLGVRAVVRKRRELWIVGATRIHLDDVVDLGRFVELETVITDQPKAAARDEHERLIGVLGIAAADALAGSYGEMIEERG